MTEIQIKSKYFTNFLLKIKNLTILNRYINSDDVKITTPACNTRM